MTSKNDVDFYIWRPASLVSPCQDRWKESARQRNFGDRALNGCTGVAAEAAGLGRIVRPDLVLYMGH